MTTRSKTRSDTIEIESNLGAALTDAEVLQGRAESSDLMEMAEETQSILPPAQLAPPARPDGANAAYPLAIIAAVLWVGGVTAYAAYQVGGGQLELDSVTTTLIALVALAPVGLLLAVAHMMRHAASLAAEARRARSMADTLGLPTGVAVQDSGQLLIGLREDIDRSSRAAENARAEMAALREAMEEQTQRLNEAADQAQRTARRLAEQLSKEREGLSELGMRLEAQTSGVIETVERQARMVADASDLAQTQLREAEAALAARAADMASAAGEAQDAARAASDDLSRQTIRLETAGSGVADQIRSVEEGLSEQRASLVQAAFGLRRDQEDFAAQVETQRAQLTESLTHARMASTEMGENSTRGVEALQNLLEAANDQVKALSDMSQTEARAFDARTREALDRFEDLAAQARENAIQESERTLADLDAALERTRASTDTAVATARERLDALGETAFEAGKAADTAAEARLEAARRVVEETAALGEDAARRIADKLEENLMEARAAIAHVEDALKNIDDRAARLPVEAKVRIDEISAAVEASLGRLGEASRQVAAETEAADLAFQDRVKRNYDMLSEAVQLMGVVSGDGQLSSRRQPPLTEPEASESLRGRLRLAPTTRDQQVRGVFEAPEAPSQGFTSEAPMSWKELLASTGEENLSEEPQAPTPARSAEIQLADLTALIRGMGIDPGALLPRARVEEAADALAEGEAERARDIVRRVAPAAVRRISRKVLTDKRLRSDVDGFVRRYAGVVAQSVSRQEGETPRQLLGSEAGRTFLLLDAAVGDLT